MGFKPSQEEIDESDEGWPDEMLEKEIFDISEDDEIV